MYYEMYISLSDMNGLLNIKHIYLITYTYVSIVTHKIIRNFWTSYNKK